MTRPRFGKPVSAVLTMGFALLAPAPLMAQATGTGPGLSSGSGQGTGSGTSSSIQRNRSGSLSGSGPGSVSGDRTGDSYPRGRGRLGPDRRPRPGDAPSIPLGPGAGTRFPDDSSLVPFVEPPEGEAGEFGGPSTISPRLLEIARSITTPEARSGALQRVGAMAILGNQLDLAREALVDSAKAAQEVRIPLVRDQRLMAAITMMLNLTEAELREGRPNLLPLDELAPPAPLPTVDRDDLIRRLQADWARAVEFSERIDNPTYRNEMLIRVVENEAGGSQTIANSFPRAEDSGANGSAPSRSTESDADLILRDAAAHASRIQRPIWRDRAMMLVAASAAGSKQFATGLEIARAIPQAEIRADALMRIAEAQARGNQAKESSVTYHEAAKAVASIPLPDPRDVVTGILIDSLISVGRFDDARASTRMYTEPSKRLIALGAVAESQGRRGLSRSARAWIDRDTSPDDRAVLYRRVADGLLSVIQQNRSRDLSNQDQ